MPRILSLTEFNQLRNDLKVGESNFDQYFIRQGKDILIKDSVDPKGGNAGSSLARTLPSSTPRTLPGSSISPIETGIPGGQIDNLSAMQMMLRKASNAAVQSGVAGGLEGTLSGFARQGITPENVSGRFTNDIVGFVSDQVRSPIVESFQAMSDTIDGIRQYREDLRVEAQQTMNNAQNMMANAISAGMWENMNDQQKQDLWSAAGYQGTPVNMTPDVTMFQVTDNNGNMTNVVLDAKTGKPLAQYNLGQIGPARVGNGGGGGGDTTDENGLVENYVNVSKTIDSGGGLAFFGKNVKTGKVEPIGAAVYAIKMGIPLDQVLVSSKNPDDETLINDIKEARAAGMSEDEIYQDIYDTGRYEYLFVGLNF